MSEVEKNKEAAVKFLKLLLDDRIDEAYQKYVNLKGKHHNLFFPAGFPALIEAMKENHAQHPNKKLIIKNVLGDSDLVAVHSHLLFRPGDAGMVVVHLFRFDNNKVTEFWDCGQVIPEDSPNKDGAF